jgi:sterol desaturase/sphingolipid hydroxylase (fatty acid hydroxylase superfamily)
LATILGGSRVESNGELTSGAFLGLDWFVLNVLFTGFLFVPFERFVPLRKDQALFRQEWREDIFYFLVSSLFVQCLTFISLGPSRAVLSHTQWDGLRGWIGSQPLWVQFAEIMFVTDLVQYWVHRAFHRIPFLWRFHAVHHSAKSMDWMAGARMHVLEILVLRAFTVMPMLILGFHETAVHIYIFVVYLYSTFIHANIAWELPYVGRYLATPRFHHWHHGIEREAIDVNFSIHFPLFDRLFGTYYMPDGKWPSGYGIKGHPVPLGYGRQFLYPFTPKKKR